MVRAWFKHGLSRALTMGRFRFSRRNAAEIDQSNGGVGEVLEELALLAPGLEAAFLELGDRMMELDGCGRTVVERCDRLLALVGDERNGAGLLRQTADALRRPLGYIDACLDEQRRLHALLAECETKTQAMLGVQGRMHDAIAPLNVMAVLFKIESAYLPADLRDTFTTVHQEVERIHKLVDDTFARHADDLRQAYATLRSVRIQIETEFERQARHIAEKRSTIDAALERLGRQLEEGAASDEEVRQRYRTLAGELGRVVTGLQFQDIVKQKCDHVAEALSSEAGASASMLALQSKQLGSAGRDLEGGCAAIAAGLARLEELSGSGGKDDAGRGVENTAVALGEMVQLLLDTLADVEDIIRMVSRLMEQGFEAVQPANGIARNLSTTIGELSMNMQLIALNAQVRSVQSGKGTGLEVLAARTAEISSEIKAIGDVVTVDLATLHTTIDEMIAFFDRVKTSGRGELTSLTETRPGTEAGLSELRDRAQEAARSVEEAIQALRPAMGGVQSALAHLPGQRERFSAVVDHLGALSIEASKNGALDHEELKAHAGRYTMESEREVHREVLVKDAPGKDSKAAEPAPAVAEAAAAGRTDDLGGNVELF